MNALFNIGYGLYVLTAKTEKLNGCIINTLQQVTSNPQRISITVNKDNYTTKMIEQTGKFNVSILDISAKFDVFERFGFSSGKDVNKFDSFNDYKFANNGIPYITKYTNSYIGAKVVDKLDVGTHIIFIVDIEEELILSDKESVTYAYYHKNIKPKPKVQNNAYVCKICGYVHNGDNLPEDFVCPICKHGSEAFELQAKEEKYVCPICGYSEYSAKEIETCIICGAKMNKE